MKNEFLRYVLVGAAAFIVDISILAGLTELAGLHYLLSASLGFLAGVSINYVLSIRWVFRHRSCQNPTAEFIIFSGIGVMGLLLNAFSIWLLTDVLGLHYIASKMAATVGIFVFNFFARKIVLFRPRMFGQMA